MPNKIICRGIKNGKLLHWHEVSLVTAKPHSLLKESVLLNFLANVGL